MVHNTKIKRIAIVGLGLIGGSLAMALKVNGYYIVGITRKAETLSVAKRERAIDIGFQELNEESLKDVDLIILAPPLAIISEYLEKIGKIVKNEIIVTDVGSTKLEICNVAKKVLPENVTFVGGHPMAGTENAGFLSAQISLFKKCAWLLTPIDDSSKTKTAVNTLTKLYEEIGSKPLVTNPEKHDRAVALVSHLPLIASMGLCQVVRNLKDIELQGIASLIASSGFRDMTRIGGGNPEMNADLIRTNHTQVSSLLSLYGSELDKISKQAKDNPDAFLEELNHIHNWRSKLYNKEGKNNLLNRETITA